MIKLPEPASHALVQGLQGSEYRLLSPDYEPHAATYSPTQLKQAIRDALEEAARVVQDGAPPPLGEKLRHVEIGKGAREAYATAIRKLKEDTQ